MRREPPDGKESTPAGADGASADSTPDSLDFVRQVAQLAWLGGLAPNAIAKHLGDPRLIMRVKRALVRAVREGILTLEPPAADKCSRDLQRNRSWKAREYLVVDDPPGSAVNPVCFAAADRIARLIPQMLHDSGSRPLVVANAGGRALSQTVKYLQRIAPTLEEKQQARLTFLSLNAASRPRGFAEASNFLAVRLAEIFGGEHFALLEQTEASAQEYARLVKSIDLLLCGAGGRDSLFAALAGKEIDLPDMVGDFAFIPLDIEGRPVSRGAADKAIASVNPHPDYAEAMRIARDPAKEVMVILDTRDPPSKVEIAHAILTSGLATKCVVGLSLARALLGRFGA